MLIFPRELSVCYYALLLLRNKSQTSSYFSFAKHTSPFAPCRQNNHDATMPKTPTTIPSNTRSSLLYQRTTSPGRNQETNTSNPRNDATANHNQRLEETQSSSSVLSAGTPEGRIISGASAASTSASAPTIATTAVANAHGNNRLEFLRSGL